MRNRYAGKCHDLAISVLLQLLCAFVILYTFKNTKKIEHSQHFSLDIFGNE